MTDKPHIVIIMADQLRRDVPGGRYTPHLNKLAEDSAEFERAYCASPLCVPARGAFFTGMVPNATGCLINPWEKADARHGKVRAGIPHLYGLLEGEWDSWNVGKQHFLTEEEIHRTGTGGTRWIAGMREYKQLLRDHGKRAPGGADFKGVVPEMAGGRITRAKSYSIPKVGRYEPGFDYFFDGFFANKAVEAIRRRNMDKPLLLNLMFLAPHPPFDIPDPWFSMWNDEDIELPDNVGRWESDQSPLQLYNLTGAVGARYTREEWRRVWRVYLGLVSLLDACVGMVVEELKRQGMYEDSLIVFTSDHGEMLGSHGLWQKMCMYEESVRTPLYVKFPLPENGRRTGTDGIRDNRGRRIADPVSAVDVLPTLCDYLGLETPQGVHGTSLLPLLEGRGLSREHLFIQYDGNGARGNFQRCIVDRRYKLIVDSFKDETYLELYHLADDPREQTNLAFDADCAEVVLALLRRLFSHMRSTGDLLQWPESEQLYRKFLDDYEAFRKGPEARTAAGKETS